VGAAAYTDTGLRSDYDYTYQVKARSNKSSEGVDSASVSAHIGKLLEELRNPTVTTVAEMEAILALLNTEGSGEWNITIGGSFSLSSPVSLSSTDAALNITVTSSSEQIISLKQMVIKSGVSLVLEGKVTLEGMDSGTEMVWINSGGSFSLEEGASLCNNRGGGVYVNGAFTMNGGEISGNSVTTSITSITTTYSRGRGVYVGSSGTFTMSGGQISGNFASSSYPNSSSAIVLPPRFAPTIPIPGYPTIPAIPTTPAAPATPATSYGGGYM
jgi:hypothetical protein